MKKTSEETKPVPTTSAAILTATPDGYATTTVAPVVPDPNQAWINFLSKPLPVVGTLSSSDLSSAAKTIESAISKAINQPVAGKIWNDSTKQFLTTPDDVKKALELIAAQPKPVDANADVVKPASRIDDRIAKMASLLWKK